MKRLGGISATCPRVSFKCGWKYQTVVVYFRSERQLEDQERRLSLRLSVQEIKAVTIMLHISARGGSFRSVN
jgi:hypothetical protein